MKPTVIIPASILAAALLLSVACTQIDDKRTPPANVYIPFQTVPQWEKYGVTGATDFRYFIKADRTPTDYPYTALTQTGYGGVLLVSDYIGNPVAYDLSCPVENRPNIRIKVDVEKLDAYCPNCHSRYEIFSNFGFATEGPARDKYGLTRYYVGPGMSGEYRVISR